MDARASGCRVLHREVHAPTGVTAACVANLTALPQEGRPPDLALVRSTLIEVYQVRQPGGSVHGSRLELVSSSRLYGVVESAAVLRSASGQRDALLLTFRDAKLSVMAWDVAQHRLAATSLHYFEGDSSLKAGRVLFPYPPRVVADPQGRAAAVLMFRHQLALLPAVDVDMLEKLLMQQQEEEEREDGLGWQTAKRNAAGAEAAVGAGAPSPSRREGKGGGLADGFPKAGGGGGEAGGGGGGGAGGSGSGSMTVGNSYVVNLAKQGIKEVRDLVFLHRYNEPVLLLLHEPDPTWTARYADRKDTCQLTALSINVMAKRHPRLWSAQYLPSDAHALAAAPHGGALVLCLNFVLYYTQGAALSVATSSMALPGQLQAPLDANPMREPPSETAAKYARQYATNVSPEVVPSVASGAARAQGINAEVAGARVAWVSDSAAVLALANGQLLSLQLAVHAGVVRGMRLTKAGGAPTASCLAAINPQLVFLGSWTGDSLLIHVMAQAAKRERLDPLAGAPPAAAAATSSAGSNGQQQAGESAAAGAAARAGNGGDAAAGGGGVANGSSSGPAKRQRLEGAGSLLLADAAGGPGAEPGADAVLEDEVQDEDVDEEEEIALYGTAVSREKRQPLLRYAFRTLDSLPGCSPMHACTTGQCGMPGTDANTAATAQRPPALVAATGHGRTGALLAMWRQLIPDIVTQVPQKVAGMWALHASTTVTADTAGDADASKGVGADGSGGDGAAVGGSSGNGQQQQQEGGPGDGVTVQAGGESAAPAAAAAAGGAPALPSSAHHSFLLLTISGATQVLDTRGEELQEITDQVQYDVAMPTVHAGNVCGARFIAQVVPHAVRLLSGTSMHQEVRLASLLDLHGTPGSSLCNHSVAAASVADPYVLLHLDNGTALVLGTLGGELRVVPGSGQELQGRAASTPELQITACSLYSDFCGWLAAQLPAAAATDTGAAAPQQQQQQQAVTPTYVVVARASGLMQLYTLPDLGLVGSYAVASGERLLENLPKNGEEAAAAGLGRRPGQPTIVEARMESFGPLAGSQAGNAPLCERPVLMVLMSDDSLLAYQAVRPSGGPHQPVRLLRMTLPWVGHISNEGLREQERAEAAAAGPTGAAEGHGSAAAAAREGGGGGGGGGGADGADVGMALALTSQPLKHQPTSRIARFDGVGESPSASGLFVCGVRPLWLAAARGTLVPHPMDSEGAVAAFTAFHNVNCPLGFIIATIATDGGGDMRICGLPPRLRLDTQWPLQKISLRATPHAVTHYPEARLFAVLSSRQMPYAPWLPEEKGGDPQASFSYACADKAAKARGTMEGHEVRLLLPGVWTTLWRQQLMSGEAGLSCSAVHLQDSSTKDTQPLLAVGTAFLAGEDYPVMGRVLFFKVTKGPTPIVHQGVALPAWRAQQIYSREFKGPVTSLQSLGGLLLMGAGTRVEVHGWSGSSLLRYAFYDAPIYVTSLSVVKNFILASDVHKGLLFLQYIDEGKQLTLRGKDFDNSDTLAANFVTNGSELMLLGADAGGSLRAFEYKPLDPMSWKGAKLLPVGQMHIGHQATSFLRVRLSCSDSTARHAALYCTTDGSLGYVSPLWNGKEQNVAAAPSLQRLQQTMALGLTHMAGLNPAAFRRRYTRLARGLHGGQHFGAPLPQGGFLDGDLLWEFGNLPPRQQRRLAQAAGTNSAAVLRALREVDLAAAFF